MLKIKRLRDCTIADAVEAWNVGFEGYFFDMTTTPDKFVARMGAEGLSAELSVVAYWNELPVGIILNGIRKFQGEWIGWNGGTGVAKEFRSKGFGRRLLEATLDILQENDVHVSTLEAISENKRAIFLYQSIGYEIVDHLECLEKKNGKITPVPSDIYRIKRVRPQQIGYLSFYQGKNPWQTHWQSMVDGEAIIAEDSIGEALGYVYYRKTFSEEGILTGITVYQCEADRNRNDQKEVIQFLLSEAFRTSSDQVRLYVPNLPRLSSSVTYDVLKELEFVSIVNLVYMKQIL